VVSIFIYFFAFPITSYLNKCQLVDPRPDGDFVGPYAFPLQTPDNVLALRAVHNRLGRRNRAVHTLFTTNKWPHSPVSYSPVLAVLHWRPTRNWPDPLLCLSESVRCFLWAMLPVAALRGLEVTERLGRSLRAWLCGLSRRSGRSTPSRTFKKTTICRPDWNRTSRLCQGLSITHKNLTTRWKLWNATW
jgi:hypothetical protein